MAAARVSRFHAGFARPRSSPSAAETPDPARPPMSARAAWQQATSIPEHSPHADRGVEASSSAQLERSLPAGSLGCRDSGVAPRPRTPALCRAYPHISKHTGVPRSCWIPPGPGGSFRAIARSAGALGRGRPAEPSCATSPTSMRAKARRSRKRVTAGFSSASFCRIASPVRHSASAASGLPVCNFSRPRLLWMNARQ